MPDIKNCTLAILDRLGNIVGTGFLVSDQYVLTCSHVVRHAKCGPSDEISLRFSVNLGIAIGYVSKHCYYSDPDVAIIEINQRPEDAEIFPLAKSAGYENSEFESYGYTTIGDIDSIGAVGTIIRTLSKGKSNDLLQLSSKQAGKGMSGAPVFQKSSASIVGMIIGGHDEPGRNDETTFAVTTETIWGICQILARLKTLDLLSDEAKDVISEADELDHNVNIDELKHKVNQKFNQVSFIASQKNLSYVNFSNILLYLQQLEKLMTLLILEFLNNVKGNQYLTLKYNMAIKDIRRINSKLETMIRTIMASALENNGYRNRIKEVQNTLDELLRHIQALEN